MTQSIFVQVKRIQLLEYVTCVDILVSEHTRLEQHINDCYLLASIVDATWTSRLDRLSSIIMDMHPSQHKIEQGLLRAYSVMGGHEE